MPLFKQRNYTQDVPKPASLGREISFAGSSFYEPWTLRPYNPAELYQKRGNYDLYDEIREDDQVKAVLTLKKIMVLNSDWDIECESDDIKEFLKLCLTEYLDSLFTKRIYEVLSALDYGWSCTEKIFDYADTKYGKKIVLAKLKTRPPHTFDIMTDDYGNISGIVQHTDGQDLQLDQKKFIIYANNSEFDNPYGNSEINKGVYRAWWSKNAIIKFWNIYLERFGMPTHVGKMPRSAGEAEKETFKKIIKNIQSKSGVTIPNDFTLELLEVAGSGASEYEKAINKYDTMIARSCLVPDLIGLSGSETAGGSYALGKEQFNIFYNTIAYLRNDIQRLINKEIITPLVVWNFGSKHEAKFKFNIIDEERKRADLTMWLEAVKSGNIQVTPEQVEWFCDQVNAPKPDSSIQQQVQPGMSVDENGMQTPVDIEAEAKARLKGTVGGVQGILEIQKSVTSGVTDYDAALNMLMEIYGYDKVKAASILGDKKKLEQKLKDNAEMAEQISGGKIKPKNKEEEPEEKPEEDDEKKYTLSRALTKYEKKIDFAQIETDQDKLLSEYLPQFGALYKQIINALVDDIKRKKIVENKRFELIGKLQPKYIARLKQLFKYLMQDASELAKSSSENIKQFNVIDTTTGLTDEDIVKWIDENAEYLGDIEAQEIMKKIKGTLIDGIRSGAGIRDIVSMVEKAFTDLDIVGIQQTSRIEMIVRTTISKAYNEVRAEQFKTIQSEIQAYQFSAIMDSRTSDVCAALDGKIFKPQDIDYYNPPLHPNCRSLLVPIFIDEEMPEKGASEYNIPSTDQLDGGFLKMSKEKAE